MGTDFLSSVLRLRRPLTLAAAAAVGLLVLSTGIGGGIDETIAAARHGFRLHPASGAVTIVEIDERSIRALQHWPWPRGLYGEALDRLRDAGARLVAYDVDLSSPSDRREDGRFAAALHRAGGATILPVFRQEAGSGQKREMDSAPIPPLAQNAFLAAAGVRPDADGRLRRMPYGLEILGAPRPSLSSMMAERAGGAGDSFPLDLSIDPASISRVSMVDLLRGKAAAAALQGRRVVIGSTAVELHDLYPVPRYGVLPGVVIQALAAETLLAGVPREAGGAWPLLVALLAVLGALLGRTRKQRIGAAAVPSAGLVYMAFAAPLAKVSFTLAPSVWALAAAALFGSVLSAGARNRARALSDPETGLPNLAALEADAARMDRVTVAIARIEGHAALASALAPAEAAELVRSLADRVRFAAPHDRVYRIDEGSLAWIEEEGGAIEERFDAVAAVARAPLSGGRRPDVRLHFGAAAGAGAQVRTLAANAGLAARQAADKGVRGQFFTRSDGDEVKRGVSLLAELDGAFADGRIWNAYQPKLDLRTGALAGAEALVRWDHPRRGPLAPDSFVPLIEQHGRADDLTLHVLSHALEEAIGWGDLDAGRAGAAPSAVNVSATLLHDHGAMLRLQKAVRASGLAPERLIIEITETAAMADPARAILALESWRDLGAGVSIDDYGTGQSSLSYLQKLPATELKIDRSFVATIATEPRNAIMVRSTIAMAHELGLKVVAEGVEDESCLALLREMGCDLVQGYLIGRPMAAEAMWTALGGYSRHTDALRDAG